MEEMPLIKIKQEPPDYDENITDNGEYQNTPNNHHVVEAVPTMLLQVQYIQQEQNVFKVLVPQSTISLKDNQRCSSQTNHPNHPNQNTDRKPSFESGNEIGGLDSLQGLKPVICQIQEAKSFEKQFQDESPVLTTFSNLSSQFKTVKSVVKLPVGLDSAMGATKKISSSTSTQIKPQLQPQQPLNSVPTPDSKSQNSLDAQPPILTAEKPTELASTTATTPATNPSIGISIPKPSLSPPPTLVPMKPIPYPTALLKAAPRPVNPVVERPLPSLTPPIVPQVMEDVKPNVEELARLLSLESAIKHDDITSSDMAAIKNNSRIISSSSSSSSSSESEDETDSSSSSSSSDDDSKTQLGNTFLSMLKINCKKKSNGGNNEDDKTLIRKQISSNNSLDSSTCKDDVENRPPMTTTSPNENISQNKLIKTSPKSNEQQSPPLLPNSRTATPEVPSEKVPSEHPLDTTTQSSSEIPETPMEIEQPEPRKRHDAYHNLRPQRGLPIWAQLKRNKRKDKPPPVPRVPRVKVPKPPPKPRAPRIPKPPAEKKKQPNTLPTPVVPVLSNQPKSQQPRPKITATATDQCARVLLNAKSDAIKLSNTRITQKKPFPHVNSASTSGGTSTLSREGNNETSTPSDDDEDEDEDSSSSSSSDEDEYLDEVMNFHTLTVYDPRRKPTFEEHLKPPPTKKAPAKKKDPPVRDFNYTIRHDDPLSPEETFQRNFGRNWVDFDRSMSGSNIDDSSSSSSSKNSTSSASKNTTTTTTTTTTPPATTTTTATATTTAIPRLDPDTLTQLLDKRKPVEKIAKAPAKKYEIPDKPPPLELPTCEEIVITAPIYDYRIERTDDFLFRNKDKPVDKPHEKRKRHRPKHHFDRRIDNLVKSSETSEDTTSNDSAGLFSDKNKTAAAKNAIASPTTKLSTAQSLLQLAESLATSSKNSSGSSSKVNAAAAKIIEAKKPIQPKRPPIYAPKPTDPKETSTKPSATTTNDKTATPTSTTSNDKPGYQKFKFTTSEIINKDGKREVTIVIPQDCFQMKDGQIVVPKDFLMPYLSKGGQVKLMFQGTPNADGKTQTTTSATVGPTGPSATFQAAEVAPVMKQPVVPPAVKQPVVAPVLKQQVVAPAVKQQVVAPVVKQTVVAPVSKQPIVPPILKQPVVATKPAILSQPGTKTVVMTSKSSTVQVVKPLYGKTAKTSTPAAVVTTNTTLNAPKVATSNIPGTPVTTTIMLNNPSTTKIIKTPNNPVGTSVANNAITMLGQKPILQLLQEALKTQQGKPGQPIKLMIPKNQLSGNEGLQNKLTKASQLLTTMASNIAKVHKPKPRNPILNSPPSTSRTEPLFSNLHLDAFKPKIVMRAQPVAPTIVKVPSNSATSTSPTTSTTTTTSTPKTVQSNPAPVKKSLVLNAADLEKFSKSPTGTITINNPSNIAGPLIMTSKGQRFLLIPQTSAPGKGKTDAKDPKVSTQSAAAVAKPIVVQGPKPNPPPTNPKTSIKFEIKKPPPPKVQDQLKSVLKSKPEPQQQKIIYVQQPQPQQTQQQFVIQQQQPQPQQTQQQFVIQQQQPQPQQTQQQFVIQQQQPQPQQTQQQFVIQQQPPEEIVYQQLVDVVQDTKVEPPNPPVTQQIIEDEFGRQYLYEGGGEGLFFNPITQQMMFDPSNYKLINQPAQENALQDGMVQEGIAQQGLIQETVVQDGMVHENILQQSMEQNAIVQDSMGQNAMVQESMGQNATVQEFMEQNVTAQDTTVEEPMEQGTQQETTLTNPMMQLGGLAVLQAAVDQQLMEEELAEQLLQMNNMANNDAPQFDQQVIHETVDHLQTLVDQPLFQDNINTVESSSVNQVLEEQLQQQEQQQTVDEVKAQSTNQELLELEKSQEVQPGIVEVSQHEQVEQLPQPQEQIATEGIEEEGTLLLDQTQNQNQEEAIVDHHLLQLYQEQADTEPLIDEHQYITQDQGLPEQLLQEDSQQQEMNEETSLQEQQLAEENLTLAQPDHELLQHQQDHTIHEEVQTSTEQVVQNDQELLQQVADNQSLQEQLTLEQSNEVQVVTDLPLNENETLQEQDTNELLQQELPAEEPKLMLNQEQLLQEQVNENILQQHQQLTNNNQLLQEQTNQEQLLQEHSNQELYHQTEQVELADKQQVQNQLIQDPNTQQLLPEQLLQHFQESATGIEIPQDQLMVQQDYFQGQIVDESGNEQLFYLDDGTQITAEMYRQLVGDQFIYQEGLIDDGHVDTIQLHENLVQESLPQYNMAAVSHDMKLQPEIVQQTLVLENEPQLPMSQDMAVQDIPQINQEMADIYKELEIPMENLVETQTNEQSQQDQMNFINSFIQDNTQILDNGQFNDMLQFNQFEITSSTTENVDIKTLKRKSNDDSDQPPVKKSLLDGLIIKNPSSDSIGFPLVNNKPIRTYLSNGDADVSSESLKNQGTKDFQQLIGSLPNALENQPPTASTNVSL